MWPILAVAGELRSSLAARLLFDPLPSAAHVALAASAIAALASAALRRAPELAGWAFGAVLPGAVFWFPAVAWVAFAALLGSVTLPGLLVLAPWTLAGAALALRAGLSPADRRRFRRAAAGALVAAGLVEAGHARAGFARAGADCSRTAVVGPADGEAQGARRPGPLAPGAIERLSLLFGARRPPLEPPPCARDQGAEPRPFAYRSSGTAR